MNNESGLLLSFASLFFFLIFQKIGKIYSVFLFSADVFRKPMLVSTAGKTLIFVYNNYIFVSHKVYIKSVKK